MNQIAEIAAIVVIVEITEITEIIHIMKLSNIIINYTNVIVNSGKYLL